MKRKLVLLLASIILCGSTVFAQTNWHFELGNTGQYASHLNTWVAVELDGVRLQSPDIEVAAFDMNGECRGRRFLNITYNANPQWGYLADISIFKDNAGEVYSFKMYDHATETEYDDCPITVTSQVAGEEMGATPMDPTVLVFTSPDTPTPSGPEHPWIPASFASNMSIFAEIQINGEPVSGDNWEVGAFCDGECRGDQIGTVSAPTDFGQMLSMVVYGLDGDVINFYLYDIENESIVGECSTTVTYEEQGHAGVVWDPLILNFITIESYNLDIVGYGDGDGNYYLIASPIGEVSPKDVTFMVSNNYDLYYFNQSEDLEWINYKPDEGSTDPGFNLIPGKGYLYANSNDVTLSFIGHAYNGSGAVTLSKDVNAGFPGWNLVGNPFAQTAYTNKPFYTMNSEGTEIVAGDGNEVGAMQGIFVIAEEDEEIMNFSTEPIDAKGQIVLNVSQDRGTAIDRAIVRFGQADVLPKFMLNQNSTKMYISKDEGDFAVVRSNNNGRLPVCFHPAQDGMYTISANVENEAVRYLHLIDKQSEVEIDLLTTPSYSFEAKKADNVDRFLLVFRRNNFIFKELFTSGSSNSFGFFNDGNWIINNEGDAILQVVDVEGRILSSEEINGSVSKRIEAAPGVYMLRLIKGNDVKVQKIVIK